MPAPLRIRPYAVGVALIALVAIVASWSAPRPARAAGDFRRDWAVSKGFTLAVDSTGFSLPAAMAFVPHPGHGPKDPLYFVAELRGQIKVVTNDRSVHAFADLGLRRPHQRYPALGAQNGAAGMCVDQRHGYVFVTYAVFDADGVLRNGMTRLSGTPGTFGLRATGSRDVGRIFAPYPTMANHQIGGCAVAGDSVFVGVGDGTVSARAQNVDQLSGKIVRMTLDGAPYPGNPFLAGAGDKPRRFVWAYGLRNPFGLATVGDQLFATQNGNNLDSFLRIQRGRNFGWDGSDDSIETNAEAIMNPSVAPVHLAYYGGGSLFPKDWAGTFFFGSAETSSERSAGVMSMRYDVGTDRVVSAPTSFVRFRRAAGGEVAAVALGPDGLYFAGLVPNPALGTTPVYRVTYDPAARYPYPLELNLSGSALFERFGCRSCHTLDNIGGSVGPNLDRPGLEQRVAAQLQSPAYKARVAQLDKLTTEPYASARRLRDQILGLKGDPQVLLWLEARIHDPKFDDPQAAMPKLGLTKQQSELVANFLVNGEAEVSAPVQSNSLSARVKRAVKSKKFQGGVALGFVAALVLAALVALVLRRRRPSTA